MKLGRHTIHIKPFGLLLAVAGFLCPLPWNSMIATLLDEDVYETPSIAQAAAATEKTETVSEPNTIFSDALGKSWWIRASKEQSDVDLESTTRTFGIHPGNRAIRIRALKAGNCINFVAPVGVQATSYSRLVLHLNGGVLGNQVLRLRVQVDGEWKTPVRLAPLASDQWMTIETPLALLQAEEGAITGIELSSNRPQPVFYLDEITLE